MRGYFIVLEGLDGTGKSTQARTLAERLKADGHDTLLLREPTDGVWGKQIRKIAAEGRDGLTIDQEVDLFINDRADDVRFNILPALKAGKVIVMDRYYWSNFAYQGALGADRIRLRELNRHFPKPDLTIFLDLSPEDGLKRIGEREGGANEGFEKQSLLERVYWIYKELWTEGMTVVNASGTVDEVAELVYETAKAELEKR